MGRPKKNKEEKPAETDETKSDRKPETVVGGANPQLLTRTIKSCKTIDADLAKHRGDKAAALERFQDGGGNKKMLKWSMSLANMETDVGKDALTTFMEYLKHQGIIHHYAITFAQGEMFSDGDLGNSGNGAAEPEESDDETEGGESSEGGEDVGQQQAAAFSAAHAH